MNTQVDKFERQKSHLQLIIGMMQKLGIVSGLEITIDTLLRIITESIDGKNTIIYYLIDGDIYISDIQHKNIKIDNINDKNVKKVFETHEFIEITNVFDNTFPNTNKSIKHVRYVFPLMAENCFIAALKIDDLQITDQNFKDMLQDFFNYAAKKLKNEILLFSNLRNMQNVLTNMQKQNQELMEMSYQYSLLNEKYSILRDKFKLSENMLSEFLRVTPIPLFVIDKNHKVIQWNKALENYSGILAKDIIGTNKHWKTFYSQEHPTMADLLVEEQIDKMHQLYKGNFQKSTLINDSYEATDFLKKMGSSGTWFHYTATSIRDPEGNIMGVLETAEDITKRVLTEEALRKSEEKYRLIAENTADIISVFDLNLKPVYISPVVNQFRGISIQEAMTQSMEQILTPDSLQKVNKLFADQMTMETSHNADPNRAEVIELEEYCKDGSTIWVEVAISFIRDANNSPTGILTVTRNISKRKLAEEALRKSEEKYRLIFEYSPFGIFLFDKNGAIIECNDNFVEFIGSSREKIIGFNIINHPNKKLDCAIQIVLNGQLGFYEGIYSSLTVKKKTPVRGIFAPVKMEGIGITGGLGIVEDISESKKKEELLRISEERFQQVLENTQEWIWEVDANGLYTYSNPVVKKIIGYDTKEIIGNMYFYDFFHPDDSENQKKNAFELFNQKKPFNELLNRNICKNGEIAFLLVSGVPVLDGNGNLIGYRGASIDITMRKQAEEALRMSEKRYRLIAEYTANTIAIYNYNYEPVYIIPSVQKMRGYTAEEAMTQHLSQSITPESFKKVKKIVDSQKKFVSPVNTSSRVIVTELEAYCKNGSIITLETAISALRDTDLKSNGFLLVMKDITERKLAENDLREEEIKFHTVADYIYDWEYWQNENRQIIYMSPSSEKITGYKPEEFILNPSLLKKIIHPDDFDIVNRHLDDDLIFYKENNICDLEFRIINKNGKVINIEHICRPVFDSNNKSHGRRITNRDITKRKLIEKELIIAKENAEERELKYRLLSENISDGIFICKKGCFEYINNAMNDIFGYHDNELVGLEIIQLAVPEHKEELWKILNHKSRINQIYNLEMVCLKKDLSTVFVEMFFNYVADERVIYGVVHNITEKKQIQKNIIKAIIQTEEKEKANFSKELHDGIGPLLSIIKMHLQWSRKPNCKKPYKEIIIKAEQLIEETLTTVKEISNKLSPNLLINYGLTAAIQSFIDKLIETSTIRIDFQSNLKRMLNIEIEATFYRAIIECINNSIKHANAYNIYILLNDTGTQLQIQYSDDGIGFDLTKKLSESKGLGLINIQNRIKTIGGKITFFSQPGQGFNFQIIMQL